MARRPHSRHEMVRRPGAAVTRTQHTAQTIPKPAAVRCLRVGSHRPAGLYLSGTPPCDYLSYFCGLERPEHAPRSPDHTHTCAVVNTRAPVERTRNAPRPEKKKSPCAKHLHVRVIQYLHENTIPLRTYLFFFTNGSSAIPMTPGTSEHQI